NEQAAGIALIPGSLFLVLFSSSFGRLAARFGPRLFMTAGPGIMALGLLWFAPIPAQSQGWVLGAGQSATILPSADYFTDLLPGLVVFGIGLCILVTPLTTALMTSVPARNSGVASAINNSISRVGSPLVNALIFVAVATSFYASTGDGGPAHPAVGGGAAGGPRGREGGLHGGLPPRDARCRWPDGGRRRRQRLRDPQSRTDRPALWTRRRATAPGVWVGNPQWPGAGGSRGIQEATTAGRSDRPRPTPLISPRVVALLLRERRGANPEMRPDPEPEEPSRRAAGKRWGHEARRSVPGVGCVEGGGKRRSPVRPQEPELVDGREVDGKLSSPSCLGSPDPPLPA